MPARGVGITLAEGFGLDRHVYHSGYYYWAALASQSATTSSMTQSALRLVPWWNPSGLSISKIGGEITSAAASSTVRFGIYNDDGNGYPGTLKYDSGASDGTIDGNSATVQDVTCATPVVLTRGLYWIGGVAQGGNPSARVTNVNPQLTALSYSTSIPAAGAVAVGYSQSSVTGALPATFAVRGSANSSGTCIRVHFKVT